MNTYFIIPNEWLKGLLRSLCEGFNNKKIKVEGERYDFNADPHYIIYVECNGEADSIWITDDYNQWEKAHLKNNTSIYKVVKVIEFFEFMPTEKSYAYA